jgi:hypothetical protein
VSYAHSVFISGRHLQADHVNLFCFVTCSALSFYNPETQAGFSVPYPVITLHATSRGTPPGAPDGANHPCVYCQLDETDPSEWDNLPEDELPETKELYIYTQQDSAGRFDGPVLQGPMLDYALVDCVSTFSLSALIHVLASLTLGRLRIPPDSLVIVVVVINSSRNLRRSIKMCNITSLHGRREYTSMGSR